MEQDKVMCCLCEKEFPMDLVDSIGEIGDGKIACKNCISILRIENNTAIVFIFDKDHEHNIEVIYKYGKFNFGYAYAFKKEKWDLNFIQSHILQKIKDCDEFNDLLERSKQYYDIVKPKRFLKRDEKNIIEQLISWLNPFDFRYQYKIIRKQQYDFDLVISTINSLFEVN